MPDSNAAIWDWAETKTEKPNGHTSKPEKTRQARLDAAELPKYAITWGKHKGKDVGDVPSDYLVWCLDNMEWFDPTHQKFNRTLWEIVRRRLNLPIDLPKIEPAAKPREPKEPPLKADEKLKRTLKTWYASMSRRFHPDLGGSAKEMVVVNLCYDALIELLEGSEKK
jgi:hypothetical protein